VPIDVPEEMFADPEANPTPGTFKPVTAYISQSRPESGTYKPVTARYKPVTAKIWHI